MEEGVAGQDVGTLQEPVVEHPLLCRGRMESIPRLDAATRGSKARQAQLCAVTVGDGGELVELGDVLSGHHHADLELAEIGGGEVVHGRACRMEGPLTAHGVIGRRQGTVDADLHVDVVHPGQTTRPLGGESGPVGRELHPDLVLDGVPDEVEEVRAQHRFAPADIDVEDLHGRQLVHDVTGFGRRQLHRVTATRRAQAVHAGQIAGVGQLPGQADGCFQALGEPLAQRHDLCGRINGHRLPPKLPSVRAHGGRWVAQIPGSARRSPNLRCRTDPTQ